MRKLALNLHFSYTNYGSPLLSVVQLEIRWPCNQRPGRPYPSRTISKEDAFLRLGLSHRISKGEVRCTSAGLGYTAPMAGDVIGGEATGALGGRWRSKNGTLEERARRRVLCVKGLSEISKAAHGWCSSNRCSEMVIGDG